MARYDKVHLFQLNDSAGNVDETTTYLPGEGPVSFGWMGWTIGLSICYDLRFPEMFRDLTELGAQTFLLCSGWPTPRIEHWRVLARARAIEDLAWVVAANGVGSHAGITLGGHSIVVDPLGEIVAEAAEHDNRLGCWQVA